MVRLAIALSIVLNLMSLVGCGGGSDDGPTKGSDQRSAQDRATTSYFLNITQLQPEATSEPAGAMLKSRDIFAASALTGNAISNLVRQDFDAAVTVPDFNAPDGSREVPIQITQFESFGNGVYQVDIDGLPQLNGYIYVNIGSERLVILMLIPGSRAEPVDLNPLTSAVDGAIKEAIKSAASLPSEDDVLAARGKAKQCLESQSYADVIDIQARIRDLMTDECALPPFGEPIPCTDDGKTLCTVGGTITNLNGLLRLQLNGDSELLVTNNGAFRFPTRVQISTQYAVTIVGQPPGQICSVENGSGTASGPVEDILIDCSNLPDLYLIGGAAKGLLGPVVLRLNDIETLEIEREGEFAFETPLESGTRYTVELVSDGKGQSCSLSNTRGTVKISNIDSIQVTCTLLPSNRVAGTVSGIVSWINLTLTSNSDAETITVAQDGAFGFTTQFPDNTRYRVEVTASGAGERCDITNAEGTLDGGDAELTIDCTTVICCGGNFGLLPRTPTRTAFIKEPRS